MTYRVRLSPHAVRAYRKLPATVQSTVREAIEHLQQRPTVGAKIKRLKGRLAAYHRYRVGDYRIVYHVDQAARIVSVDFLQHRRDVYR